MSQNSSSVVQFIWINFNMKWMAGSIDHPIPGCKSANWSNIIQYQKLVHDGANAREIQQQFNPTGITPNEKRYGVHPQSTKPSSAHGPPHSTRPSSGHGPPRSTKPSSAHGPRTTPEPASPKSRQSRTQKTRKSPAPPDGSGQTPRHSRSLRPHGDRPRDESAMHLLSNPFDLCDAGSPASQDWSRYNCGQHIGPCCGDGTCDAASGETSLRCAADCGTPG